MSKYGPLRQGDVREDGKIFWRYYKGNEYWLSKSKFKKYKKTMKRHADATSTLSKHRNRPSMYSQHPVTLLYYVGVYSGKERWVDFEALKKHKRMAAEARERYVNKQKQKPSTELKFGDRHPSDPGLWVICKQYNSITFGSYEEYLRRLAAIRECSRRKAAKYKIKREKVLRDKDNIHKRGDIKDDLIFWGYGSTCIEYWLTPEQFESKLQHKLNAAARANERRRIPKRNSIQDKAKP